MKKISSKFAHYLYMVLAVFAVAFATTACSDDNTSDLQLTGN